MNLDKYIHESILSSGIRHNVVDANDVKMLILEARIDELKSFTFHGDNKKNVVGLFNRLDKLTKELND